MPSFTSMVLEAYLSGVWVNLTADWLVGESTTAEWGISGVEPQDIMPDVGEMQFTLKNTDGRYSPDSPAPLAGWGYNVKVRLTFVYSGTTRRVMYYVDKIDLQVGSVINGIAIEDRVRVTALDWLKFAVNNPILAPDIELLQRADQGIQTVIDAMLTPPSAVQLDTGRDVYPVVFDGVGLRTTAYSEFVKFVTSDFGTLALLKDATYGEKLRFFNYASNSAGGVATYIRKDAFDNDDIDAAVITYGDNIINRAVATAYPKRIDTENRVLYSLGKPMRIRVGETITFRAKYTDPDGGSRVNAIGSTMLTPEVPGAVDPYLMTLLNFTDGFTDETGRHTWTNPEGADIGNTLWNDVYKDGFGTSYSNNILGSYTVFGGYPNYKLTAPTSADFEFGAGAFTIGWYENRINPAGGNVTMARDSDVISPFLLGWTLNNQGMYVSFSSNGVSYDIKDGGSLGEANVGRWTYYEVSRDSDGWFYCFADGRLTDTWHSTLAIKSSTGAWTIGNTQGNNWCFMAFDSFFIKKGECLHNKDFEPPRRNIKPTLDGDYLLNTAEDGTGTDISVSLDVTADYGSEAVTYTLYNNGTGVGRPKAGYITHLQARGKGVYPYNSIEASVTDTISAAAYNYREINIDQKYRPGVVFGTLLVDTIVSQEANPRSRMESISFFANRSATTMANFILRDVHDLVHVVDTVRGIDNFFFIQKVRFSVQSPDTVYVTWKLKSALDVDASFPPPVPPTFQGVIGTTGIDQLQVMGAMVLTQAYTNALSITLNSMDQLQDMGAMVLQQVWAVESTPVINANNWKNVFVFDDFISAVAYAGANVGAGDLSWVIATSTDINFYPTIAVSPTEHPGVTEIYRTATGLNWISIAPLPAVNMVNLMQYVGMFNAISNAGEGYAFGLMDNTTVAVDGMSEGVYFQFTDGDTNWQCVTTLVASTTRYDTGVAFAADTWFLFEIKRTAADTFEFYINRVLVGTHQSDLVTDVVPMFGMDNEGASNSAFIDYFAMQLAPITQRWD